MNKQAQLEQAAQKVIDSCRMPKGETSPAKYIVSGYAIEALRAALAAPEPDDTHFEGYDQARRTLATVTDKSELLTTLDAFQGRGELSEDSPLDQLRQAALDQQERDWRIDPRRI